MFIRCSDSYQTSVIKEYVSYVLSKDVTQAEFDTAMGAVQTELDEMQASINLVISQMNNKDLELENDIIAVSDRVDTHQGQIETIQSQQQG